MAKFYTAAVTVFTEERKLDVLGNQKLYERLIHAGSDGIVLMGSTGEFFHFSIEKAKELIDLAAETIHGRMKLIVGISRMEPKESIELGNYALSQGADAVMAVSPYYFKLSDASIERYFDQVASGIQGELYLYNFPNCTGYDLTPALTYRLRKKHANIKGYKDTISDFGHTRRLCETMLYDFPDFEIYSGFDEFFVPNVLAGGSGCIGGLPNMAPELFVQWVNALNQEDWKQVGQIQKKVNQMMGMFEICSPFLTAVKHAMKLRGIIDHEYGSEPFVLSSPEENKKIEELMKKVGLL